MKIVHLCLSAIYADRYAYQENLLPKYHLRLGHEVEIIASAKSYDDKGRICYLQELGEYKNEYGIRVVRLPYLNSRSIWKKLKRYRGTIEVLQEAKPDILFIHGCQFLDIDKVIVFLKSSPQTIVYVDNHADFNNSATNWISRNILHRIVWRSCAQRILPYVRKFYGVLPERVDFLKDVYGLPEGICELLVMGGDDELIENTVITGERSRIRDNYGISDEDFLIVTGGKINHYRPEVLNLMQAVIELGSPNVKLLFFGAVIDELKAKFDQFCENDSIIYAGWVKSSDTYGYFAAGDLAVFPGLHSVMWEQAVAQGIPCVFRDIVGFHHVDVGGNARFLGDVSAEGIRKILTSIIDNREEYAKMKEAAVKNGPKFFSYKEIARRCIQE